MQDTRKSGIYIIVNSRNGKFYIGSARNFKKREREHFSDLKLRKHHCKQLQRAYNKEVDKLVFSLQPFFYCSPHKAILLKTEQWFLDMNWHNKEKGVLYNGSMIAGRVEWTPEMRRKLVYSKAKLTEVDVLFIRASTKPHTTLAKQFGVSLETIRNIRHCLTWKHLEGPVSLSRKGYKSKLTEVDVFYIRESIESGVSLARKFNVRKQTISAARTGRSWKHI